MVMQKNQRLINKIKMVMLNYKQQMKHLKMIKQKIKLNLEHKLNQYLNKMIQIKQLIKNNNNQKLKKLKKLHKEERNKRNNKKRNLLNQKIV